MKSTHFKNIGADIVDVDTSGRTIVAYVSKFGNIDRDGDMMMQGCYKKSIIERGKSGTDELFHLSNHRIQPEYVLSKPIFEEDSFGLKMTSKILCTEHGEDIIKMYDAGIINQHSVMFTVPNGQWRVVGEGKDAYTEILQAKLYEGSTVLWGANPETPTIEVKNLFKEVYNNDLTKAFNHFSKLIKAFKTGKFTDEFFAVLDIEIKLLETMIAENFVQKGIDSAKEANQPQEVKQDNSMQLFFQELQHNIVSKITHN